MRKPFLNTLTNLAEKNPKIIFLICDVGFRFVEEFKERFPNQFLNCGAAEQSAMGIAAGMARMGYTPVVYTMRNFIAFRPYEQVRNDIAFGNANVKLFGVSGSAAYAFLGMSHNTFKYKDGRDEDIAMLSELPNMKVFQSKTEEELIKDMETDFQRKGPSYFII